MHRRRFAHWALVLAWMAFWLNTALIPCCEAFAATSGDHASVVVHATPSAEQTYASHDVPVVASHHEPDSPCGPSIHEAPATNGEQVGLAFERVNLEWDAAYSLFTNKYFVKSQTANPARFIYDPWPRQPRYDLQTQRLLI